MIAGLGNVREASRNVLTVSHFAQLTREICPRLVTDVAMCPRSSSHTAQNLSIRSPTVNTGFSIGFSLSRWFVPLRWIGNYQKTKASGLYFNPGGFVLKKQSPELSSNRLSSESDRRHHYYGRHRNHHDRHRNRHGRRHHRHRDLREPWPRSRLVYVPRPRGR